MEQEFKEKLASWKETYDTKVKAQFQKEMDNVVSKYEQKIAQIRQTSKKEINELKDCYNSLVKEQDSIIARDKVCFFFWLIFRKISNGTNKWRRN